MTIEKTILDGVLKITPPTIFKDFRGDGSFYLVVVNYDPDSKQYKKFTSFTLSDKNRLQILVPPKFGNGHLVLSDTAIFHYKQNTNYIRESQFTIKWNDPNYNFGWPIHNPILSERDK